ncbi:STAS domain-containing protein [Micromonospora sp. LAH09]|uniref:STAS domain-containing protein n=1 Tax=Micromonospora cabrerizensis TaxID=2911213 RepID=UPI001EE8CA16|nr:STAS domain-containing protein [Micromonospora cabrerizensis]MCG5470598.1 STAS domain-containing protein [Micromonospora cabrerizensis]
MSLALTCAGPAKLVTVAGEIDMSNAHLLTELVACACHSSPPVVAVDLSGVRFFSAHGVGALLEAQHVAVTAGVAFILRDPAPCVTYLLATSGALGDFRLNRGDGHRPLPRPATADPVTPVRDHPLTSG